MYKGNPNKNHNLRMGFMREANKGIEMAEPDCYPSDHQTVGWWPGRDEQEEILFLPSKVGTRIERRSSLTTVLSLLLTQQKEEEETHYNLFKSLKISDLLPSCQYL